MAARQSWLSAMAGLSGARLRKREKIKKERESEEEKERACRGNKEGGGMLPESCQPDG